MERSGKAGHGPSRKMRQDARAASDVDDQLIYDVGAHLGEDTDFYLRLGYRVVVVEANPELAEKLRARFADALADGRVNVVEVAVAQAHGTIDFFVNEKKSVWGTANADWAARNERVGAPSRQIAVASAPFGAILREFGMPYYLKVDIEGSDPLCIVALQEFEARPKFVSIEASVGKWRDLVHEFDTLERLGYDRFQIVRQGRHESRTLASLYGEPINYSFDADSSGPFGNDLQGAWLTGPQALRRYRLLWLRERLFSEDTAVGRLFAKLPLLARIPASVGWYDTHAKR